MCLLSNVIQHRDPPMFVPSTSRNVDIRSAISFGPVPLYTYICRQAVSRAHERRARSGTELESESHLIPSQPHIGEQRIYTRRTTSRSNVLEAATVEVRRGSSGIYSPNTVSLTCCSVAVLPRPRRASHAGWTTWPLSQRPKHGVGVVRWSAQ